MPGQNGAGRPTGISEMLDPATLTRPTFSARRPPSVWVPALTCSWAPRTTLLPPGSRPSPTR